MTPLLAIAGLLTLAGPGDVPPPEAATTVATMPALRAALADPATDAIHLRAGVYEGDLEIRRPVRLLGERGAVLRGSGQGDVLRIEARDVLVDNLEIRRSGRRSTTEDAGVRATGESIVLRRLAIDDTLFGVALQQCKRCELDRVRVTGLGGDDPEALLGDAIKLWEVEDSTVRGCEVDRARDVVVWYSRRVALVDNAVRRSRYGTHLMHADDVTIEGGTFEENVVGIFVMYSTRVAIDDTVVAGARGAAGMGIGLKESESVTISRASVVANTTGIYFDRAPRMPEAPVRVVGSRLALNGMALRLHGRSDGVHVRGNDFVHNMSVVEVEGARELPPLDAPGNFWTDYEGYDLDRDRIGDVPFEVRALSRTLVANHPELEFFREGVAMGVIDAMASAVPLFGSRVLLRDPEPRTTRSWP